VSGTPDPWQLNNVYSIVPPGLKLALAANLEQLKICRGNGNIAGGVTPPTSVSCILANVPAFTVTIAPAVAPAAGTTVNVVKAAVSLGGYSVESFDIIAQAGFVQALAPNLGVAPSAISLTSIASAPAASGRHLLQTGGVVVNFTVSTASAAAASSVQTTLASQLSGTTPLLLVALRTTLPTISTLALVAAPATTTVVAGTPPAATFTAPPPPASNAAAGTPPPAVAASSSAAHGNYHINRVVTAAMVSGMAAALAA
jgi:hypothetical protein